MAYRSPLVTLGATAVGLVALLVVNSTQTGTTSPGAAAVTSAPATTSAPPSPDASTPAPEPTTPAATPTQQIVAVYTGRTTRREATLAIAVKGDRAAAYVCDGRRVEAWMTGTHTAGRLALRSKAGDQLVGNLAGDRVTGTVTVRGRQWSFTIEKAAPPAGLYRAKTSSNTIGWIVLPDGSQVGIDNDGSPAPAPPLDPASGTATVGGAAVTAASITCDETF